MVLGSIGMINSEFNVRCFINGGMRPPNGLSKDAPRVNFVIPLGIESIVNRLTVRSVIDEGNKSSVDK